MNSIKSKRAETLRRANWAGAKRLKVLEKREERMRTYNETLIGNTMELQLSRVHGQSCVTDFEETKVRLVSISPTPEDGSGRGDFRKLYKLHIICI